MTNKTHHPNEGGVARQKIGNLLHALAILRENHHTGLDIGTSASRPIRRLRTTPSEMLQNDFLQFSQFRVTIEQVWSGALRWRSIVTAPWTATNSTTPHDPRGRCGEFPAKISEMASHFGVAVDFLLGPGVGAVGEGVGEIVVEGTETVEE